jgi:ribonuclease P protein component
MLTILATANGLGYPRLGLAIAKKNARRALDRNRIKRIIRESFRQNQTRLPAIDLVVMAKPQTKSAKNSELFISLEYHWTRLIKQCAKFSSA